MEEVRTLRDAASLVPDKSTNSLSTIYRLLSSWLRHSMLIRGLNLCR